MHLAPASTLQNEVTLRTRSRDFVAAHVDLSGHSGVITLSSAQLLKVRARTFLIHIKALHDGSPTDDSGGAGKKVCSQTSQYSE